MTYSDEHALYHVLFGLADNVETALYIYDIEDITDWFHRTRSSRDSVFDIGGYQAVYYGGSPYLTFVRVNIVLERRDIRYIAYTRASDEQVQLEQQQDT